MAQENVMKFEQLLQSDKALQARLAQAAASYEGDKSDERAIFDAVVAPIAVEAGLEHTFDEVVAVKDNREIDDAELDALAGGWSICLGPGVCSDVSATCNHAEGHACAYAGIGWFAGGSDEDTDS